MSENRSSNAQLQETTSKESDGALPDQNALLLHAEASASSEVSPHTPSTDIHNTANVSHLKSTHWYRSLKFKLFMLTNLLIFISIGFLSYQNSTSFRGVLRRQSQENLVNTSLLLKNSIEQNLKYWVNVSKFTLQSNGLSDLEKLKNSFQNILQTERSIVGLSIYKLTNDNVLEVLRVSHDNLTQINSPSTDKDNSPLLTQINYQPPKNVAKELIAHTKQDKLSYFGSNLSNPKEPLIYVGTKFIERRSDQTPSQIYWSILTIRADHVSGLLSKNETISQFLVDHQLNLALAANNQTKNFAFTSLKLENIKNVILGKSKYALSTVEKTKQMPVTSVATAIVPFDLLAITQRKSNLDQLQINYQIRNFLLLSWIVLLISIAVTYLFANAITRSLSNVVTATVEISKGKFDERVQKIPKDEIGVLAHAVNRMASDIGTLMGVREQAIRQQSELKMAEQVQKTMIPEASAMHNSIETASFFKSATECAGDWWGRFSLSKKKELVVISDVTGHGAHSALVAALAYGYFSTFESSASLNSKTDPGPETILRGLNRILFKAGGGSLTMSAIAIVIDHSNLTALISNAGHCPPELVQGNKSQAIQASGDIIGLGDEFNAAEVELILQPNDIIFTYTDGLFECKGKNGKTLMKKKIRTLLSSTLQDNLNKERESSDHPDTLDQTHLLKVSMTVSNHIVEHFKDQPLTDDITLLFTSISQARFKK